MSKERADVFAVCGWCDLDNQKDGEWCGRCAHSLRRPRLRCDCARCDAANEIHRERFLERREVAAKFEKGDGHAGASAAASGA